MSVIDCHFPREGGGGGGVVVGLFAQVPSHNVEFIGFMGSVMIY